jgi:hypothetical protein
VTVSSWAEAEGPSRPGEEECLVVSIVVLALRIPKEEQMMIEDFGEEYQTYMQRTGSLLPKWGSPPA